jgi:hypothetical protein
MSKKQVGVIATFSGSKITVQNKMYQATWNTAQGNLDTSLIYAVRVSVNGTQLGLAEVLLNHTNVDPTQYVSLTKGESLRIKFFLNGCASVVCSGGDQCHAPGRCDPATTKCSAPTNSPDGTACNDGDACTQTDACQGGLCVGSNLICGGGADGSPCMVNKDCLSGMCVMGVCQGAASCFDGIQNGTETDTDCGGGTCPTCAPGRKCLVGTDCVSGVCNAGVCG